MLTTSPNELLVTVAQACDQHSKTWLARCNRRLNEICTPELYSALKFKGSLTWNVDEREASFSGVDLCGAKAMGLSKTPTEKPFIAASVQSLDFSYYGFPSAYAEILELLPKLPNVERLRASIFRKFQFDEREEDG